MSHRFLIAADAMRDDCVHFSPEQQHQLRHVLRLRPGDTVRVFDGQHDVDYVVELVGPGEAAIVGTRPQAPEPRTRVVMYPSLLQRDKFESVLQKVTELGVNGVVPVLSARSIVREPPDDARLGRWRAILREATEQSGRGAVPWLGAAVPFAEALRHAQGRVLMAYEGERRCTLRDALEGGGAGVSVFVGPEGGYAPEEVEQARAADVRVVTLGPRILRTETASPVLAALVLYELGDLSSEAP